MPNVMAAMPNTGGALCSMPQSLVAEVHHIIRTVGGGIDVQLHFFPIVDTCLSCEDTARQNGAMVPK